MTKILKVVTKLMQQSPTDNLGSTSAIIRLRFFGLNITQTVLFGLQDKFISFALLYKTDRRSWRALYDGAIITKLSAKANLLLMNSLNWLAILHLIWEFATAPNMSLIYLLYQHSKHSYDHRQQNIKSLDWILLGNSQWKNVLNFHGQKNGGHFERRAAIGRRNTPHHNYISVHARKLTSSCLHT